MTETTIKEEKNYWRMKNVFYTPTKEPLQLHENNIIALGFDTDIDLRYPIDNNRSIEEYIDKNCKQEELVKNFANIKKGDYVIYEAYMKIGYFRKKKYYIGEVLEDFSDGYKLDNNLGHTLPVKWITNKNTRLNKYVYTNDLYYIDKKLCIKKLKTLGINNDESSIYKVKDNNIYIDNQLYRYEENNELLISIDETNIAKLKELKKDDVIFFINSDPENNEKNIKSIEENGVAIASSDFNKKNIIKNSNIYKLKVKNIKIKTENTEYVYMCDLHELSDVGNMINKIVFNESLNTIIYGPPGTGKTYSIAKEIIRIIDYLWYKENIDSIDQDELNDFMEKNISDDKVRICTFHQSYGYEDFIEGLKSDGSGNFKPEDGLLKEIAIDALYEGLKFEKKLDLEIDKESLDKSKIKELKKKIVLENIHYRSSFDFDNASNYVLVIDEINRGNIAKIFGELITLLEDDKRLTEDNQIIMKLPYSKEYFCLPPNLYIVGTMNTADKSIALMDIALRRRFKFKEMMPNPKLLKNVNNIDLEKMLDIINKRIEFLYDRDYMIGHAYLINVKNLEDIVDVFKNKMIPLLQEYFYDDWEKIGLILGGIGKNKDDKYIVYKQDIRPSDLFKDNNTINKYTTKTKYYIKDKISIEELRNIYE